MQALARALVDARGALARPRNAHLSFSHPAPHLRARACARAGFCELVPPSLISLFTPEELELLIAGLPDIDVADLKRHTEYLGYRPTDEAVQFFWQAVESFDASDRARLLMFVTGTSKVPLGGFKALRGQRGPQLFTLQKAGGDPEALPASHTCFVSRRPPPLRTRASARTRACAHALSRTPWRSPLTATRARASLSPCHPPCAEPTRPSAVPRR